MSDAKSPARDALMLEAAKRVRSAIDKRDETLAQFVQEFDSAAESGDDEAVKGASIMLVIFASGLVDPVATEIRRFTEVDGMLKRAEASAAHAGGER